MASKADRTLMDTLYTQCFMQLVRTEVSPVFVEKRILEELVGCIRRLLLARAEELRSKVQKTGKYNQESYLTINAQYYEELANKQEEQIREFEKRVKETKAELFLGEDFSKVSDELELNYPKLFPTSAVREGLWKAWKEVCRKRA
jgi:hypothetical protein